MNASTSTGSGSKTSTNTFGVKETAPQTVVHMPATVEQTSPTEVQTLDTVEQRVSSLETAVSEQSGSIRRLDERVGTIMSNLATEPARENHWYEKFRSDLRCDLGELKGQLSNLSERLSNVEHGVARMETSQVGFFDRLFNALSLFTGGSR
ncbi:hypothetical protein JVT61DRAFT_14970 [Boletus reticuloceps]|uniref:Uncharacterized protein n=1 Tax=Boletus reticuloceps TaxID=495285 RepID=A0A8I3A3V8_9AGAM|nr:hypothetical protein JVT61DRAFT_14970 [Boletus reticuloceps]